MRLFFDSSAFAKRLVEEPGGEAVERLCRDATSLSVSILCYTEILSALNRRLREKNLTRSRYSRLKENLFNDLTDAEIVLITSSVVTTSIRLLERTPLRTLDALQIACAVEWEAELFVTSDKRQMEAAQDSELKVQFVG